MQLELTLEGKECSGSKPSSPISHYSKQPPANTNTNIIQKWTQTFPRKLPVAEEGFIDELMVFVLRYFEQIRKAAVGHPEAASVCEYELMFRLLRDDNNHLDLKLVAAPEVQEKFVSNLVVLLIVLGTGSTSFSAERVPLLMFQKGYDIFSPVSRNILKAETDRVVEQASQAAFVHLTRPAQFSPKTLSEFLDAAKTEIESRIANLHELVTIIHNLVEDFEETEPRRVDEIRPDHPQPPKVYQSFRETRQGQRPPRSAVTPPSGSSSTSHGAEVRSRLHSTLSTSSTKQSSRPTSSPSTISLVSSKKPISSTPPSEAKQSQNELKDSGSTHTSTSYEKGDASDVPAEVE